MEQDKTSYGSIVIVGGAGGIGQCISQKYLDGGEQVVVVDRVQPAFQHRSLKYVSVDVTDTRDIQRAATEIKGQGITVRHLVSLAGGALPAEFESDIRLVDDNDLERSIRLNLTSHLWLTKYFMGDDPTDGSDRSVVFVSSINALRGYGLTAYTAAKAGLLGATRELACSLASRGIRVNAVLPGTIPTPRTSKQPKDMSALLRGTALGRFATPEDIASCCYFLTHLTKSVTGQNIVVDAGQSVHS